MRIVHCWLGLLCCSCTPNQSYGSPQTVWLAPGSGSDALDLVDYQPPSFVAPAAGAGTSSEAAYVIVNDYESATYHFVLDAVITSPVTMTFDLITRTSAGDNVLVEWTDTYAPSPDGNLDAQAFEYDEPTPAVTVGTSDESLVFRYTADPTSAADAYLPNCDGSAASGRMPNITLAPAHEETGFL